jgi:hypothetical protein
MSLARGFNPQHLQRRHQRHVSLAKLFERCPNLNKDFFSNCLAMSILKLNNTKTYKLHTYNSAIFAEVSN